MKEMKLLASFSMLLVALGCVAAELPQSKIVPPKSIPHDRMIISPSEVQAINTELNAAPEQRAKVADSLIPLRDEKGRITGYIVHIRSAPEAFARFGIQNGDIIRKINNMPMTEAKRWKYIVEEILTGKVNGIVVDIERGGEPRKLVCIFREKDSNNRVHGTSHKVHRPVTPDVPATRSASRERGRADCVQQVALAVLRASRTTCWTGPRTGLPQASLLQSITWPVSPAPLAYR